MTPTPRNSSRLGNPTRVAARVATMLASSTSPPASSTRYSCCKLISSPFGTVWVVGRADERQMMRVGIAGAGAVGRSVAQELLDYGHKVLLIEHNVSHYEPHTVPGAEWLLADACELSSLEESGIQMCDVVIAATGDDKVNLTAALLAKTEFGGARGVARTKELRNEWLFTDSWGRAI